MLDEQARDVSTFDRELIAGMAAGDRQAFEQALKSRLHRARLRLAGALRCAAPLDSVAQEGGQ
ncbi:MAG: hypothetical protein JRF48_11545 [Deltaproteobacteria bacterium]|nr:hypothetical protein [Deltaproteobacteria bacterium]MBW2215035.1 hypothetical protein [Deltaproteobacteria bacterium]